MYVSEIIVDIVEQKIVEQNSHTIKTGKSMDPNKFSELIEKLKSNQCSKTRDKLLKNFLEGIIKCERQEDSDTKTVYYLEDYIDLLPKKVTLGECNFIKIGCDMVLVISSCVGFHNESNKSLLSKKLLAIIASVDVFRNENVRIELCRGEIKESKLNDWLDRCISKDFTKEELSLLHIYNTGVMIFDFFDIVIDYYTSKHGRSTNSFEAIKTFLFLDEVECKTKKIFKEYIESV